MLEAFKGAVTAGRGGDACIAAALEAAKDYPMARDEIDALAPQSPLEAMLQKAAERPPQASLGPLPVYAPREGANETQVDTLEGIEMAEGASRENAWAAATSLLAAGQGFEAPLRVVQTPTSDEIVRMIKALARDMRAEGLLEVGEPRTIENDRADESAWAQPRRAGP
jgi:hypothetical protein